MIGDKFGGSVGTWSVDWWVCGKWSVGRWSVVFIKPNYLNEVFQTAPESNIQTRGSFLELKYPFRKPNAGQMALPYTSLTILRKTPDTLERTKNLNTFKHNLKEHYLKEIKNSNFRQFLILKTKVCNISPF